VGDVFADGLAWLRDKLKTHASQEFVYRRGTQRCLVRAVRGRAFLRLTLAQGSQTGFTFTDQDFLIAAADLRFEDGKEVEPRSGDEIHERVGYELRVFQVLAPTGEPVWRWSDCHRLIRRVHAQFVRTELL
jgi:hypothetical protein